MVPLQPISIVPVVDVADQLMRMRFERNVTEVAPVDDASSAEADLAMGLETEDADAMTIELQDAALDKLGRVIDVIV